MSNVIARIFEGNQVRAIERAEELWWVLVDVCRVLGLTNPSQIAATRLDDDEKGLTINETPGGAQQMIIVSEAGLYAVIQQSRKPVARRFDRWVRHEVLPQIRRTGNYIGAAGLNVPMREIEAAVEKAVAPMRAEIADVRDCIGRVECKLDKWSQHEIPFRPVAVGTPKYTDGTEIESRLHSPSPTRKSAGGLPLRDMSEYWGDV